jgi:hypothetical protein
LIKFVTKKIKNFRKFIFADFQLLDKNKFSGVEKIKTIGNTYMAAAGLNPGAEHRMVLLLKKNLFCLIDNHLFYLDKRTIQSKYCCTC